MASTPTTLYPSTCNALSHLFLCSNNSVVVLRQMNLENMVVGEHLDLLIHENVITRWEGWALYPNDEMVAWPPIAKVENQHSNAKTSSHKS